ncbi:hypothetical protein BDR22DRAFT_491994 [Usnea florida]
MHSNDKQVLSCLQPLSFYDTVCTLLRQLCCCQVAMSNALCFYPNGSPSLEDDIPCGAGSAVGCCPLNWACLANGLCYLQNEDYYGRYTCTDQSWGPGCPNICTYNDTAKGNEAVLECTTDSYCCDTNRPELSGGTDCCDASPSRFSIDGNSEVPITSDSPVEPVSVSAAASSTSSPVQPVPLSAAASSTSSPVQPIPLSAAASSTSSPVEPVSVSAAASSTSAQTSVIASVAAPSITCNSSLGETFCGSICCASDQYCAFAGQCSATSVTTDSSSGTSTPTFESIVSAARTSPSSYTPNATRSTSIANSESASLAAVSSVTPSSITSPSTRRTNKPSAASTTTPAGGTPSVAPSPSVTNTTKFKAGVPVGAVVTFVALLLLALYYWRRHRRRRQPEPNTSGNASPSKVAPIPTGVAEPPNPNPYRHVRTSDPSLNIHPDHDTGDHHSQSNLRFAPALNPYNPASAAAFSNQSHLQSSSRPPSYVTEDPEGHARASRSRLSLIGRNSGLQEVQGDESGGA